MNKIKLIGACLLLACTSSFASPKDDIQHLQSIDAFQGSDIKESQIEGLYLSSKNGKTIYVDKTGNFIISGQMFERKNNLLINLKDKQDREARYPNMQELLKHKDLFAHYPSLWVNDKGIADKRASIYVFSDITCPHCKAFHKDIVELQKSGIEIFYVPFPRKGLEDYEAVRGLQKILCSKDKSEEYNKAFFNPSAYTKNVNSSDISCNSSYELLTYYKLADNLGVIGTPAIFTEKGSAIFGYNGLLDFATTLKQNLNDESFDEHK